MKASLKSFHDNKIGKLKLFKVICSKCGKEFSVTEHEKLFPQKEKYFCSSICARSHIMTNEIKNKISSSLKKYYNIPEKFCIYCHLNKISKKSKFCSTECRRLYHWEVKLKKAITDVEKEKILIKKYRNECSFKFNLADYPDKFDFELIKKYGWYKPKNRGNNLNGVSRDHMYSIMDGYKNNVDPKIISHPANCRLIRHNENVSKGGKSCISLDELLKRIDEWK